MAVATTATVIRIPVMHQNSRLQDNSYQCCHTGASLPHFQPPIIPQFHSSDANSICLRACPRRRETRHRLPGAESEAVADYFLPPLLAFDRNAANVLINRITS